MKQLIFAFIALGAILGPIPCSGGLSAEFVVYSVYRGLNLGNPGEPEPPKDYYVNIGSSQGIHEGSVLEVLRRTPTYDLLSEELYRDMTFPIALIKVIHSESAGAIARLDQMLPPSISPSISPRTIMVGDIVKLHISEK